MNKVVLFTLILLSTISTMPQNSQTSNEIYVCPPCGSECDKIEHHSPGVCSHCNMPLVKKNASKTIAFYLQDGVEVLDFAGPLEVFVYAGYQVFTVSARQEPIKSQGVLTVVPDYSIENAPEADILAFFGGNSGAASQNKKVIEWVTKQTGVDYHFSVCTGAFVLAEAGILDGKIATTFHSALDNLQAKYPKIDVRKNVRFVDNGKVITTAGISAGIDGALHLVAKLQGLNAAKRTAYYMEYDNWNLGDGLILAEDNPYLTIPEVSFLKSFEGTYEYTDGNQLKLVYDDKDNNLVAKLNGSAIPIYHETEDIFSEAGGRPVFFKRNGNGSIVGYAQEENGKIFKKL